MNYEILYDGAFAMLKVQLQRGERFKAESGAMVSMTPTVDLKGSAEGGMFAGFGRMISGEKFFFQELTAAGGSAEILLSPSSMGMWRRLNWMVPIRSTYRRWISGRNRRHPGQYQNAKLEERSLLGRGFLYYRD
jgi:hypothetical protein